MEKRKPKISYNIRTGDYVLTYGKKQKIYHTVKEKNGKYKEIISRKERKKIVNEIVRRGIPKRKAKKVDPNIYIILKKNCSKKELDDYILKQYIDAASGTKHNDMDLDIEYDVRKRDGNGKKYKEKSKIPLSQRRRITKIAIKSKKNDKHGNITVKKEKTRSLYAALLMTLGLSAAAGVGGNLLYQNSSTKGIETQKAIDNNKKSNQSNDEILDILKRPIENEIETETETETETEPIITIIDEDEKQTEGEIPIEDASEALNVSGAEYVETEDENETEVETEDENETEVQTKVETEIENETETQTEVETEIENETEIQTEVETEIENETETQTEVETEIESQTETQDANTIDNDENTIIGQYVEIDLGVHLYSDPYDAINEQLEGREISEKVYIKSKYENRTYQVVKEGFYCLDGTIEIENGNLKEAMEKAGMDTSVLDNIDSEEIEGYKHMYLVVADGVSQWVEAKETRVSEKQYDTDKLGNRIQKNDEEISAEAIQKEMQNPQIINGDEVER